MIGRDIIVTIPKSIAWEDYEKELTEVRDGSKVLNFKTANFPQTNAGNRCYVLHDGEIKGWMKIVALTENDFTCEVTGKTWKGKFIQRSGPFHYIPPIEMKGFQGFRYVNFNL